MACHCPPIWPRLLCLSTAVLLPAAAPVGDVFHLTHLGTELTGSDDGATRHLEDCLRSNIRSVVMPHNRSYSDDRHCKNRRADIIPKPLAIVRVDSVNEVQAAVRCSEKFRAQACARAGGHGFENDAGCTGGILIDVQDLQSLIVDEESQVVEFGAGHTLGQLYFKLNENYRLVVPGGSVSGVGAAGLFLGCGHGHLTQMHGLACDSIRGVEYVDAQGNLQIADAVTHPDMYWMARGGGGNFPGIVTKFMVQAFKAPRKLHGRDCIFNREAPVRGRTLLKEWLLRLHEMSEPQRKMSTHVEVWGQPPHLRFRNLCFDCDSNQLAWFENMVQNIADGTGAGDCHSFERNWMDQILIDSGVGEGKIENSHTALMDRNQGWGSMDDFKASKSGANMVLGYEGIDEVIDTLMHSALGEAPKYPWQVAVLLYPMGGSKVEDVPAVATAYGPRKAKAVIQYKHQWQQDDADAGAVLLKHHEAMTSAMDSLLPCAGFFNFLDNDRPCAHTNDEWLATFFSDVGRMKDIKVARDPQDVFRSRLFGPSRARNFAHPAA